MRVLSVAVLQMTGDIDPAANARTIAGAAERAAGAGAALLLTPEMSNLVDRDRARAAVRIGALDDDVVVRAAREAAARHGIAIALGSVAVRDEGAERLSNRSVFIDEAGRVLATYDKMHLFDVALGRGDDWRESAAYRPGERAVTVDWAGARFGLSVCYDLRFPALYQALSGAGAEVLLVPAAFTRPTGAAHWRTLAERRARSRTPPSCSPPPTPANTRTGAPLGAIQWRSIRGASRCWRWESSRTWGSPRSTWTGWRRYGRGST